jgi:hypothetical protein
VSLILPGCQTRRREPHRRPTHGGGLEIGISVALIELLVGIVVGNAFSLDVPSWLSCSSAPFPAPSYFLAGTGPLKK